MKTEESLQIATVDLVSVYALRHAHFGRKSCYWDFSGASLVLVLLESPAKHTAFVDFMQVGSLTLNRRNSAVFQIIICIIITFHFIVCSGAKSTLKGFIVEDLHGKVISSSNTSRIGKIIFGHELVKYEVLIKNGNSNFIIMIMKKAYLTFPS